MSTEVGAPTIPIYLAGEFVEAGTPLEVRDPATGELVGTTWQAGPEELERATSAAVEALPAMRGLASYERRDALAHVPDCIARDAETWSRQSSLRKMRTVSKKKAAPFTSACWPRTWPSRNASRSG